MQFIDLSAQQKRIRSVIEANIAQVLEHGKYILGPEVSELEKRLEAFTDARHAIACASGTDALLMALMAYGIGPGDAVLTTPFTFISTAEVISLLGAVPVFVDIDSRSFNIEPGLINKAIEAVNEKNPQKYPLPRQAIENRLSPKGIIAVDLFGLSAEYEAVNADAKEHGLFLIEDAAQSFGGEYSGKKCGSLADIACTSFFPAKPLGCYGDGGMCFTDSDDLSDSLSSIRVHGKGTDKYDNVRIGINGRLDTLQAAILLAKLDIFEDEIELRQTVAERYQRLLAGLADIELPKTPPNSKSVWAQFSILARDGEHRAELQSRLQKSGVPTAIYYPKPLHLQTAFSTLGYNTGDFPVSEDCSQRIFSLPMHPYLTESDQEKIAAVLIEAQKA